MRKFITYTDRVLHVHHPRVTVETAVAHGAPRDALFERTELTPQMLANPDMRVSYAEFGMLCVNALRLSGNPALGLHIGRNIGLSQMGVVGFLYQNCPTLGAALEASRRYVSAFAPAWEFEITRRGDVAALTFREALPLESLRRTAHEIMLAAWDTQTRALAGNLPIPVRKAELPFSEPAYVDEYRKFFGDVALEFDRPVATVEFDPTFLDVPIALADPVTAKLAEQFCAQLIPAGASQDGLVGQIRRLLASDPGAPPALTDVARKLQTSTRTLRRELQKMGTSYKELVDDSRRERALAWIETNSMPIEKLATGLGFATVGSFRRAFKRWTGDTPSARRLRG
jgi:AraC-like DNA-binding protein